MMMYRKKGEGGDGEGFWKIEIGRRMHLILLLFTTLVFMCLF
jgi:hypothetical protein